MKNPKIDEQALVEFYEHCVGSTTIEEFRNYCKRLVMNARAPNHQLLRQIDTMPRAQLCIAINNFAFKGQGLGVIK